MITNFGYVFVTYIVVFLGTGILKKCFLCILFYLLCALLSTLLVLYPCSQIVHYCQTKGWLCFFWLIFRRWRIWWWWWYGGVIIFFLVAVTGFVFSCDCEMYPCASRPPFTATILIRTSHTTGRHHYHYYYFVLLLLLYRLQFSMKESSCPIKCSILTFKCVHACQQRTVW